MREHRRNWAAIAFAAVLYMLQLVECVFERTLHLIPIVPGLSGVDVFTANAAI